MMSYERTYIGNGAWTFQCVNVWDGYICYVRFLWDNNAITVDEDSEVKLITENSASDSTPLMDGTAYAGSGRQYARWNHVHPTDTSRQATLVSGTNIKTVKSASLLGSGDIAIFEPTFISKRGGTYYKATGMHLTGGNTVWTYDIAPLEPDEGHLYIDIDTDKTYRWTTGGWAELSITNISGKADKNGSASESFVVGNVLEIADAIDSTKKGYVQYAYDNNGAADAIFFGDYAHDSYLEYVFPAASEAHRIATIPKLVTISTAGAVTQALDPNKFYKFTGSLTSLTLTLNAGVDLCIYAGKFVAGSDDMPITLPSGVVVPDESVEIESGKTYEFSIMDNVCLITDVTYTSQ